MLPETHDETVSGGLVDVTLAMRHEAAKAHQMGLISLGDLNRQLVGEEPTVGDEKKENRKSHKIR